MYNKNYYKTVTWVVSNSGKILSLITADLADQSINAGQNESFRVDNLCASDGNKSCFSKLLVKESAVEIEKDGNFDVTISISSYDGNMRGCTVKNVILKGLYCLLLFYNISYLLRVVFTCVNFGNY